MNNKTEQNVTKKPSMRKYIIAVVCVVFLVMVAFAVAIYSWERKPDPASEMIIRLTAANQLRSQNQLHSQARIEKEPNDLNDQDFAKLTKLSFVPGMGSSFNIPWLNWRGGKNFTELKMGELCDIKLLEKFTNLQELNLQSIKYPESKIPKLMKYLDKFGVIDINKKFAIDLSPIQNLKALKSLRLSYSQISDITPLEDLVNLEQLFIDNTFISDIEPLRGLKNLQVLSISETEVSSLEPILHLEKLQRLLVIECPNITDQQLKEFRAAHPDMVIIKDYVE